MGAAKTISTDFPACRMSRLRRYATWMKTYWESAAENPAGSRRTYVDVRKLLEDQSIDAISIATPNHWHALMAIWACQAGKDVYVEKPCSHNFWEGSQLVRAAEKYNRIVQHGTQIRSAPAIQEASRAFARASSAKCTWLADCVLNGATLSDTRPRKRSPPACTTTFGRVPRP